MADHVSRPISSPLKSQEVTEAPLSEEDKENQILRQNGTGTTLSMKEEFHEESKTDLNVKSESGSELEVISDGEVEKANNYMKEQAECIEINKVQEILHHSSSEEERSYNERRIKRRKVTARDKSPDSIFHVNKIKQIEAVLGSEPIDLEKLRQLAKEECGLIKDELRRRAWPQLMQVDKLECTPKPTYEEIKLHKDYNQVVMDVNRSLKRFPPGIKEDYRYVLMNQLTTLIVRVLDKHPHLHYYQGYHDVAITFLLVVGESVGFELVERLSLTHLQEFMRPSMERTTYYLTYLYPVLKRANRRLYDFLIKSGVGTVFCLPWLITWYAHTLSDYRNVVRLYDFFLATPYLMPMYIAVAIVLHREEDILAEECDMAMQHFILSQVPDTLPFEDILRKASELYYLYPPDDLQEEVDEMFKEKTLQDEEERTKALQRKKKLQSLTKKSSAITGILASISAKFYLSRRQKKCMKIIMFAFTATLATGLYGYYTNSPYLKAYLPWS